MLHIQVAYICLDEGSSQETGLIPETRGIQEDDGYSTNFAADCIYILAKQNHKLCMKVQNKNSRDVQ